MTSRRLLAISLAGAAALLLPLAAGLAPASADSATPSPSSSSLSPSSSAPSGTAQPLTFGIKPKDLGGPPRSKFSFLIAPGQHTNDVVSIYNLSNVPLDLRLYAADGFTNAQGSFTAKTADQKIVDSGTWFTFGIPKNSVLRVPARSRVDVPFTLKVPAKATPGDHPAALVVSMRSKTNDAQGTVLNVDSRVDAQANVRVAGELRPGLSLEEVSGTYAGTLNPVAPGSVAVRFRVRNTGNTVESGHLTISLDGPFGWGHRAVTAELPSLTPGSAIDVEVPLADVWPLFRYHADVSVQPIALAGDPVGSPSTVGVSFLAVPWAAIALFLTILALSGLVSYLYRRRRRAEPTGRRVAGAPQNPAPADDLLGV